MKLAFIADEITTFIKDHDSTWAIMQAAHDLGHEVFYGHTNSLGQASSPSAGLIKLDEDFFALQSKSPSRTLEFAHRPEPQTIALDDFDLIFMRTDPPVNQAYMHACQILSLCKRARVINNPRALLEHNEKLSIFNFPDLILPTIVSADVPQIKAFMHKHSKVVVKPLDLMGGQGIFILDKDDANVDSLLVNLTHKFTHEDPRPVMVQEFNPDVLVSGDKRLIVINGKLEGALRRIPSENDFRANIAAGGSYAAYHPNARDYEICAQLSEFLVNNGIYLAGVDVIGDYLTEINITSPTCLQEINRMNNWASRERLEYKLLSIRD